MSARERSFVFRTILAAFALVASLLVVLALTGSTAQAQAAEGLRVDSTTVFTPDLESEQIRFDASYTLTNVQADEVLGDSVRSYFFTTWVIAMPSTATDFVASVGDQNLATSIEPDPNSNNIVFGSITLPWNLEFQQTVTVDVEYSIPGGAPRSIATEARVNDSFLSFAVWASGDEGMTDVRVNIPPGFSVELQGDLDPFVRVVSEGETYYEALDLDRPRDFFGQVFGRNDSGLITEQAQLPDAVATVRAWPDDPEWAAFVVDAIEDDVPTMEELTGLEWPAGDIEVIETVTPYLYGYGGWFNASSGLIEIGDSLERDVILHELAHAWFNDDLINGRWITEGLSEEFAGRTIEENGGEVLRPTQPDLASPLRVPLAAWASPWTLDQSEAFEYEQYHYNASWWVIRQITDQIGIDEFSKILVALSNDELAYAGDGPPEKTIQSTRWTHFYDLLETRTDVTGLDELFTTYVMTDAEIEWLAERTKTLDRYDDFQSETGEWAAPLVVRQQLAEWQFASADEAMSVAQTILAVRDENDALAAELGVTIVHDAEGAYELADSLASLNAAIDAEEDLHRELLDLQARRADLQAAATDMGIGLTYSELTLDEALLDSDAQQAAVNDVRDLRATVDDRAQQLSLVSPPWPARDTAATDSDAGRALAEARLATLEAIDGERRRIGESRSLTQTVGLWGEDPEAMLDTAERAFEADELDDALLATSDVEALLQSAASRGRSRILWSSITTAVLLAIAIAVTMFRSRRTT